MAEIGVLNLTIHDNSENAAKGLDRLADALRAVKEAKQRFNLDGVGQQLTNLAKTIQEARGTSTIIKNLGTMFNAINQFAKMKDFTIDTQKLRDTAQAMIQLADAKERVDTVNKSTAGVGDWRTGMNGVAESTKSAVNEVKKDVDVFEDTIKRAKDIAGDSKGTWEMAMRTGAFATVPSGRSSGSLLPMNLQLFGDKGEVDGLKETEGVIQQSTETISKFKEAVSDTADPVKNIDLNKYLGAPLESIFNKATMAETAIRRVGDAMAHALTNMSGSAMEKAIAGNAKLATQEISGLFKMLEKKPKYDGLRQFVDAITGVKRGAQGGNVINENTTMLGPIVEQEEKLERLNARIEEATAAHYKLNEAGEMYAGTIRIFDQAEGKYKEISVDAKAIAESTADAKEKTEDFTSSIRNVIDLTNVPASGKNGVFANAAEEAKYLKEQIESTIASQEQWLSIRAAAEKQIKYGGPRSKEDLDFDMRHSEEGYYAALEAEEQYKNSLTDLLGYAKEYTETARQATEATNQQAESMNTAADAAERLNDAVAESASADVIAAQAAVNQHAIQQLMDTLNNPPNVRFVDIVDDLNGVDRTAMSARESMSAFLEAMQGDDEYASYIRDLNPELADLSDKIQEAGGNFRDLKEAEKIAEQESEKLSFSLKELKGAVNKLFPSLSNLAKRFKGMVISRSIRYVIRQIASGFSEGVQNVYKYSEAVGTSFAPAMDEAASTLLKMKNSLGAALAPAIQALIPVLQQVVNWFINLINYVNQFLALIRGQKTWTRAVDYTTKAYKDQTKEAKKASAAVKDLLADWDELNIIQSQTGGGSGTGKQSKAEEAIEMFEQVSKFDNKVREIVEWVKDNFETIKTIAESIGAAVLAWRLSSAFGKDLNLLQKLEIAAGITLLVTGIKLAAGAGYSIGKDGLNGKNATDAILSVLTSMAGGGLITFGLWGAAGIPVGLTIGAGIALGIMALKIQEGHDDSLYGDVSKDVDDIRKDLEEGILTTKAKITLEVYDAKIQSLTAAESKVETAINKMKKDYPLDVTVLPSSADDLKKEVLDLVKATQELIDASADTLKTIHVPATATFTEDFVNKAWGNVKDYVEELGTLIGKELDNGINDNIKLDELRRKLLEISQTVLTATKSSEYAANVSVAGGKVRENNFANYDRKTIQTYIDEYNKLSNEKMAEALGYAKSDYTEQKRLIASLEKSIEDGEGILSEGKLKEMRGQLDDARAELVASFGENGEKITEYAKTLFDEWTLAGRELYASDITGALSAAIAKNDHAQSYYGQALNSVEPTKRELSNANDGWVRHYITSQTNELYNLVAKASGMSQESVKELLKDTGINPLSLLDKSFVEDYRNNILSWISESTLTAGQKKRILSSFGLSLDDIEEYSKKAKEAKEKAAELTRTVFEGKSAKEQINDTLGLGNIELNNRKILHNADGTISTERSFSFWDDKEQREILIPQVVDGILLSADEAIERYYKTGEHFGKFRTAEAADKYADELHNRDEWFYGVKDEVEKAIRDGILDTADSRAIEKKFGWDKLDAVLDYMNNAGSLTRTKDGYVFNDSVLEGIYKHLNWQLADAGFEGGSRAGYQKIIESLKSAENIDTMNMLSDLIEEKGVVEAFKKLNELNLNPDGTFGQVANPARTRAYNFTTSDVGWGRNNAVENPSEPQQIEFDSQSMTTSVENGVSKGVQSMSTDVVAALNTVAGWLQRLYNKDTTVVVQPSTSLGRAVGRSNSDLGRVTGYAVD